MELLQPGPSASCSDVFYGLSVDPELGGDVSRSHRSEECADLPHVLGRELLVWGTPTLEAVLDIALGVPEVEMSRVHASGNVTGVQDPLSLRHGSVVQEPRDTVGPDHALLVGVPDDTVAEGLPCARLPEPTVVRSSHFDLGPEAIGQRRSVRCSAHGLRATRSLPTGVVHSAPSPRLDLDWAFAPVDVTHEEVW